MKSGHRHLPATEHSENHGEFLPLAYTLSGAHSKGEGGCLVVSRKRAVGKQGQVSPSNVPQQPPLLHLGSAGPLFTISWYTSVSF